MGAADFQCHFFQLAGVLLERLGHSGERNADHRVASARCQIAQLAGARPPSFCFVERVRHAPETGTQSTMFRTRPVCEGRVKYSRLLMAAEAPPLTIPRGGAWLRGFPPARGIAAPDRAAGRGLCRGPPPLPSGRNAPPARGNAARALVRAMPGRCSRHPTLASHLSQSAPSDFPKPAQTQPLGRSSRCGCLPRRNSRCRERT